MIVVANRIRVTKGYEKAFERRFEHRFGAVDHMPGFIRNEVLRPITGDHYIIMTQWETKEAFEAWTRAKSSSTLTPTGRPRRCSPAQTCSTCTR